MGSAGAQAMKQLVLASGNAGKLEELRALLADLPLRIVAQGELGVDDVPETGLTFVENALIKARHASAVTGLPALADDSGLIVDALDGAPGLYSARYAGSPTNALANNAKLLDAMRDVPADRRSARFYSVIVLLRHPED
ncbi:non-canonical purine NTP pyrophosphatase, partial [Xanthomonas vasicola]